MRTRKRMSVSSENRSSPLTQVGDARAVRAQHRADVVTIPARDEARELGAELAFEVENGIRRAHAAP